MANIFTNIQDNRRIYKPGSKKPPKKVPPECHPTKCHNTGMLHVRGTMYDLHDRPDKPCTRTDCPYCIL